jgi:hypothetical protein
VIVQTTTAKVDVLFLVDNSGSMSDNQEALAANFPLFMEYFEGSGLDYHIGVINTDVSGNQAGHLRSAAGVNYIDLETPDRVETFSRMVIMAEGSSDERGREAIYHALVTERDGANAGFIRDEASLHITVVSDEDDHSRAEPVSKDEFVTFLNQARPIDEMVSFNSIVNPPPGGLVNPAGEAYLYVTDRVGGLRRDIKLGQWNSLLDELGLQAAGLRREYFLSQLPVEDTVQVDVTVDGVTQVYDQGADWEYTAERNSIIFLSYVPPELAQVRIRYTLVGGLVEVIE